MEKDKAEKLIDRHDLRARLTAAMDKAGCAEPILLGSGYCQSAWTDESGIKVSGTDAETVRRAAAWVEKALEKAGVRATWTNSYGSRRDDRHIDSMPLRAHAGIHSYLVILDSHSIGD